MARCRCGKSGAGTRIVSNIVRGMRQNCVDVCADPVCDTPKVLSLQAPLIYDEIGINLCATFALGSDVPTEYPTATTAAASLLGLAYTYGEGNVLVEAITGRPKCYVVTLSNLTATFAVNLYDASARLVTTLYPTAVYLPSETTAPTYDESTNPDSVELEIFAPYGIAYDAAGGTPTPIINNVNFLSTGNFVRQGLNLYAIPKILDFDTDDSTITVGLTLVLQSLYFSGYRVSSEGRIATPKGSLATPEDSDCLRFVAGDLLDLAIKPLELGPCGSCSGEGKTVCDEPSPCSSSAEDDTIVIPGIAAPE